MPILIKGSGGVQEKPVISVDASGLVTATAGDEVTTHQLSSTDDADFKSGNIRRGKNVFGVQGNLSVEETTKLSGSTDDGSYDIVLDKDAGTITIIIDSGDVELTNFSAWFRTYDSSGDKEIESFVYFRGYSSRHDGFELEWRCFYTTASKTNVYVDFGSCYVSSGATEITFELSDLFCDLYDGRDVDYEVYHTLLDI